MSEGPDASRPRVRSFVLRSERLTKAQRRSIETLSAAYCLPFTAAPVDFAALPRGDARAPGEADAGAWDAVVCEIGFGTGVATAAIAEANPGTLYIGVEVFAAGIGALLGTVGERGLANIRIVRHDAMEVFERMIGPASLDGVHLFFPDPWPKKKHHKRRIVRPAFAPLLADRLKPGGYIYAVTDWEDYAGAMLEVLGAEPELADPYAGIQAPDAAGVGFAPAAAWRPLTKYERKARSLGRAVWEICFIRRTGETLGRP